MMRSFLAIVGCIASALSTHAQEQICSCSPTIFNFVLDFSNNDCEVNDITGNPGIALALCFQEEATLPGQSASDDPTPTQRLLRDGEHDEDEPRNLQTTVDIVEVVSAQFLEFDATGSMTVINQDNTYFTTSLEDGDAMQFYSVSSTLNPSSTSRLEDQTNLVPGGASLVLYGKTESGKVVRNRYLWLYEMNNCGMENNPVQVDDRIGWVQVGSDLGGAWPAFCPALPSGSPTISPRTRTGKRTLKEVTKKAADILKKRILLGRWLLSTPAPTPNTTRRTPAPTPYATTPAPITPAPAPDPTQSPTTEPTLYPTAYHPTMVPTLYPTPEPTKQPTPEPTDSPIYSPTSSPTPEPTPKPTNRPTVHSFKYYKPSGGYGYGYGRGGMNAYYGYSNPNQAYVQSQPGYYNYNQGQGYNGYQGYNQGQGYNGNQVYRQPQPQQGWRNDAWGSSGGRTGQVASYGGSQSHNHDHRQGGYNSYQNSYNGNQGYRSSQQGYGGGYGGSRYGGGQGNTYSNYNQGYSNQGYGYVQPQQSNPNYYNQYNHQRNGGYRSRRLAEESVDKALKNEAEDAAESSEESTSTLSE